MVHGGRVALAALLFTALLEVYTTRFCKPLWGVKLAMARSPLAGPAPGKVQEVRPYTAIIGVCDDANLKISEQFALVLKERLESTLRYKVEKVQLNSSGHPTSPGLAVEDIDVMVCLGWFLDEKIAPYSLLPHRPAGLADNTSGLVWQPSSRIPDLSKLPFMPLTVAFSGEAWDRLTDCPYGVLFLASAVTSSRHVCTGEQYCCPAIFWPSGHRSMLRRAAGIDSMKELVRSPDYDARSVLASKSFFAAMIVKTCFSSHYKYNDHMLRSLFYGLLSEYKPVFALGRCKPDTPFQDFMRNASYIRRTGADLDGPADMLRPYKFAITFENTQQDGYFTEKPLNAIMAGTVPIYWGADPEALVNTRAMVVCRLEPFFLAEIRRRRRPRDDGEWATEYAFLMDMARKFFQPCIDEVIALDQDDNKYMAKLRESVVPGNPSMKDSYFDVDRYADGVIELMTQTKLHDRIRSRSAA